MPSDATTPDPIDPEVVVLTAADGELYALRRSQLETFRVPAADREHLLAQLDAPEVGGFHGTGGFGLAGTLRLTSPLALPGDAVLPPSPLGHGDIAIPGDSF